jgi:hypothetical protein
MSRKLLFILPLVSLAVMSFKPANQYFAKPVPLKTLIFADGFESGNFSAWTVTVRDAGDLSVTSAAALDGINGMQALIDDNHALFVQDDTPLNESVYSINFHFDPNSISMANLDNHALFMAYDLKTIYVPTMRVLFRFFNGNYQIQAGARNNNLTTWSNTRWFNITDAPHQIEVEWDAATAGQTDGKLKLKIDGTLLGNRTGFANDTFRVDRGRLGVVQGIDNGTRGTEYFDRFESYH